MYVDVCQILEKTAGQYFKTERVVSLKIISHGASFIQYLIVLLSFFHALDFDYSNFFFYKSICSTLYTVCAVPVRVCSTHEAHPHYL